MYSKKILIITDTFQISHDRVDDTRWRFDKKVF